MTPLVIMESIEQQQPSPKTENDLRMKIVLKDNQGETKDAQIINIDRTAVQFSDIKTSVVSHFPELEKKEYVLGWIDDELDTLVTMGSDEELKVALAATQDCMLKIHVKIKQNMENVDGKLEKVQFPRQYFANLLATRQNMSGPGAPAVILHKQNIDGILQVIRKHPGVLFVGGDWMEEMGQMGEKKEQILKKNTMVPEKFNTKENVMQSSSLTLTGTKDSQKLIVNRIVHLEKAIALLTEMKTKNPDEDFKMSFFFVPIIEGRKRQHCHVLGTWADSKMICVAFKRRGDGGQGAGNIGGKQSETESQKVGNKAGTSGIMSDKGENIKKENNSGIAKNQCLATRQRMKMIASGIFSKIVATQGSEKSSK